jgi:hypothetical protein
MLVLLKFYLLPSSTALSLPSFSVFVVFAYLRSKGVRHRINEYLYDAFLYMLNYVLFQMPPPKRSCFLIFPLLNLSRVYQRKPVLLVLPGELRGGGSLPHPHRPRQHRPPRQPLPRGTEPDPRPSLPSQLICPPAQLRADTLSSCVPYAHSHPAQDSVAVFSPSICCFSILIYPIFFTKF